MHLPWEKKKKVILLTQAATLTCPDRYCACGKGLKIQKRNWQVFRPRSWSSLKGSLKTNKTKKVLLFQVCLLASFSLPHLSLPLVNNNIISKRWWGWFPNSLASGYEPSELENLTKTSLTIWVLKTSPRRTIDCTHCPTRFLLPKLQWWVTDAQTRTRSAALKRRKIENIRQNFFL